ncbi:MAG: TIGR03545 family protein [Idiomarina sp.]|nr:TIGR03545 family protein [Idiomarina sp.]
MNKVIRWRGMLAFFGFFAVLIAIVYLFAAPLLRFGLTTGLTRANGAEVNISSLNINWSPFAVELNMIEFTDPETPELNRFQAERVSFGLDLLPAMIGRVYIDELTATGIAMAVERSRPGRIRADYIAEREAAGNPTWGERFTELGFDFPDVNELLERSEIRTPQVIDEAETRSRATRDDVQARREDLPASSVVDDYEERLRELREQRPRSIEEFERLRGQLTELRDDMRSDRDRVIAFKDSVENAYEQVSTDVRQLRDAPGNDLQRIRQLIELDNDAISDIAGILFGPQVQKWTDYGLIAFDFVAPLLQSEAEEEPSRWEGRFIEFDDGDQATFLIRLAHTSLTMADIDIDLRWDNITWQHERIGSPTTYALSVTETPYWRSLSADGNFFINEAIEFSGQQQWALLGAELAAQTLLEQSNLRVDLSNAVLDSRGDIQITNGQFSGGGAVNMQSVQLNTTGERTWTRLLGQALDQVNAFDLDIGLGGRVGSPRLNISSDLDNQLQTALTGVMQEYAGEQLAEVRAQLEAEVARAMADIQPRLDQINELRTLAENREARIQGLLDEELDNLRDSALDQLRNRLGDQLRGRIGGG